VRSDPSAETRTTWNQPLSSETISRPLPSGSQRGAVSHADAPATSRSRPDDTSTMWICEVSRSGSRCEVTAVASPWGDQTNSSTSTPGAVSATGSAERGLVAGRPRRGTGASTNHT
jgi:hypothetical protein